MHGDLILLKRKRHYKLYFEFQILHRWLTMGVRCRGQGASQNAYEKSGILWRWEGPLGTPLGLSQWKRCEPATGALDGEGSPGTQ